jgi:predicted PurR-regulated permease PerM
MPARISYPDHPSVTRLVVGILVVASAAVFAPLWAPLVLAAWFAHMTRPLLDRLARAFHGRSQAAGILVLGLFVLLSIPVVLLGIAVTTKAIDLVKSVLAAGGGRNALKAIVDQPASVTQVLGDPQKAAEAAQNYGARAWGWASRLAGMTASAMIGIFLFLLGAFSFLVDGERGYRWLKLHSPIKPAHFDRFASAFHETGRGLLIGIVLTGAVQAAVATIAYAVLRVPSALVLGVLTFFASLIPSIGTALVWVPVAAGLALSGRTGAAIALLVVGGGVIGLVDNLLRPWFAHWGKLDLPSFVILLAMFGGLALIGAWGLVLGPLVVRLAVEGLRIAREERLTGAHMTPVPLPPRLAREEAIANDERPSAH